MENKKIGEETTNRKINITLIGAGKKAISAVLSRFISARDPVGLVGYSVDLSVPVSVCKKSEALRILSLQEAYSIFAKVADDFPKATKENLAEVLMLLEGQYLSTPELQDLMQKELVLMIRETDPVYFEKFQRPSVFVPKKVGNVNTQAKGVFRRRFIRVN